jgi:hypothetical protein
MLASMWIEITTPTPVLNTSDFAAVFGGASGSSIPLNEFGHPHHFEFVALKHMQFEVLDQVGPNIYQIRWPKYSESPLYLDQRFCRSIICHTQQHSNVFFSAQSILNHMENRVGTSYVWGGNWANGIPEMLVYYPPKKSLDGQMQTLWTLQGLDCSGLLFEATGGASPRNTTHLLQCGRSLSANEPLQPLDMIIYPGHVLFVRDQTTIIESKSPFGVRICPLEKRIYEISQHRKFISEWNSNIDGNSHFTIRRLNWTKINSKSF